MQLTSVIFMMAVAAGKPVAEYTRTSILEKVFDVSDYCTKHPELNCYLFDTSGYFDDVNPTNTTDGFRVVTKDNNTMIYDAGLAAFKRNKNTYYQCAPDFVKTITAEDEIGIRLTCNDKSAKESKSKSKLRKTDDARIAELLQKLACK